LLTLTTHPVAAFCALSYQMSARQEAHQAGLPYITDAELASTSA
jgi:hypothetical protein